MSRFTEKPNGKQYEAAIFCREQLVGWAEFAGLSGLAANYRKQITLFKKLFMENDHPPPLSRKFVTAGIFEEEEIWNERFKSLQRHRELMAAERKNIPDDLPPEVSTEVAAEILGCTKNTVLKFKSAGLLEWRNAAPPMSSRPVYRFTLESVKELRLEYERDEPVAVLPKEQKRHRVKSGRRLKHFRYDD